MTDITEIVNKALDTYALSSSEKAKILDSLIREYPEEVLSRISELEVKQKLARPNNASDEKNDAQAKKKNSKSSVDYDRLYDLVKHNYLDDTWR